MNIVKIYNLSKNFKKVTALDNVSLEIKEGEIYDFWVQMVQVKVP